jgi:hypothetical protein
LPIFSSGVGVALGALVVHVAAGFPTLDPKSICADVAGLGLGDAPATCQHGEEQARGQLRAIWPTVTAEERSLCLNPAHLSLAPSYADLFVCIRTHRDLLKLKTSPQTSVSSAGKPASPSFTLSGEDLTQLRHLCQDTKTTLALCARLPAVK